MRQGELFGLTTDRVNFLERRIVVDRQLVSVNNERPAFGPPKTDASNRRIPLPVVVADALLEHLAQFEAGTGRADLHQRVRGTAAAVRLQYDVAACPGIRRT